MILMNMMTVMVIYFDYHDADNDGTVFHKSYGNGSNDNDDCVDDDIDDYIISETLFAGIR